MPPPKKKRGPGRSFKKVPPKGRKPIARGYVKEWEPYEYGGGLLDEGDFDAFIDDLNIGTYPAKVYKNLGADINRFLSARYNPEGDREKDIDVETTKQELRDLPGAAGTPLSLNLKDWLDDPEKVLEKTADNWWKAVVNTEDLEAVAELEYFWQPLVKGENHGIGGKGLVVEDPVTGAISSSASVIVNGTDMYKKVANDIQKWGITRGSRPSRLKNYQDLQVDLLDSINAQINAANLTSMLASPNPAVQAAALRWQNLQGSAIEVADKVDPFAVAPPTQTVTYSYTDTSGVVQTGYTDSGGVFHPFSGDIQGRKWDNLRFDISTKGKIQDRFNKGLSSMSPATAGLGVLAVPFVPQPLVIGAAAAASMTNPDLKAARDKFWEKEKEYQEMYKNVDQTWKDVLKGGTQYLTDLGLSATEATRMVTWVKLVNYRETQSTATDFLEAVDSKSFFKFFVWGTRVAKYIPGISQYAKYLSPADYVSFAMKKVKTFGLLNGFDDTDITGWQPFYKLTKAVADHPKLANVVNRLSFGLIDTENFGYIHVIDKFDAFGASTWDPVKKEYKDVAKRTIKLTAGKVSSALGFADTDWKVVNFLQKAASIIDPSTNLPLVSAAEINGILSGAPGSIDVLQAVIGRSVSQAPGMTRDVAGLTAGELATFLAKNPQIKAFLTSHGIIDATGSVSDLTKFAKFWEDIDSHGLAKKYIGAVSSVGKNLDHLQSVAFEALFKRVPWLKGPINFFRGGWVKSAAADPKAWALLLKTRLISSGAKMALKLGLKGALKVALKAVLGAILGGIEALSNALPVLGPIITAVLAWIGQKLLGKIWSAIKGPVSKAAAFYWRPFKMTVFTDYGFMSSGENIKVVSCGCCAVGCLFPLLLFGAMGVIGGANFNAHGGADAGAASPNLKVEMSVDRPIITLNSSPAVVYTIKVTNISSSELIGLNVNYNYQPGHGVSYGSCTPSGTESGGNISFGSGTLAAGASITYTCNMTVYTTTSRFIVATVTATGTISGASVSNSATAVIKVGTPAEIAPCGLPDGAASVTFGCSWHQGSEGLLAVDLPYGDGTEIHALIAGNACRYAVSTENNNNLPYGVYIDITGDGGYRTRYAHLQPIAGDSGSGYMPGKPTGSCWHVGIGGIVGKTGSTGYSTGYHLHYEIFDPSGSRVCPETYVNSTAAVCSGGS
ncbi:MAG: peptidoglycan DD-metalloendopeptidase family protein [candidate division WWE3 bacterium]|nr:peptidoglycan DD-metalloendopeptidase family protein [candidate division WWE3 bacterium]